MRECPACDGRVFDAVTIQGKAMLIDLEPVGPNNGNVVLTLRTASHPLAYVERNPGRLFGKKLVYTDHNKTCPKSKHRTRTQSRTS